MSSKKIDTSLKIIDGLSRKELIGGKTKKETEILKSLTDWHNKSSKRNFFIGEKSSLPHFKGKK